MACMKRNAERQLSRTGQIAVHRLTQKKLAEAADCSIEDLERMKTELTRTISKYINLGEQEVHLYLRRGRKVSLLAAAVLLPAVDSPDIPEIVKRRF